MYEQISANKWKSGLLVFIFVIFVLGLGYVIGRVWGGPNGWMLGLGVAFVIALVMGLVSYYQSDKIALSVAGARELQEGEYIRYRSAVEGLAIAAGVPTPRNYVIDDASMNAFATGRNPENSAIAATTGLLEVMNDLELQGVVAHEMSHIRNYDILLMTITIVLAGTIVLLSEIFLRSLWFTDSDSGDSGVVGLIFLIIGIVLAILAPLIAYAIKFAISRRREYLADANGALLTRYPLGLANALQKLADDGRPLKRANNATAHLYISQPLKARKGDKAPSRSRLFDTHPPIGDRIAKLEEMAGSFTEVHYDAGQAPAQAAPAMPAQPPAAAPQAGVPLAPPAPPQGGQSWE